MQPTYLIDAVPFLLGYVWTVFSGFGVTGAVALAVRAMQAYSERSSSCWLCVDVSQSSSASADFGQRRLVVAVQMEG